MEDKTKKALAVAGGTAAAAGAGVAALGIGTIVGSLVRDAYRAERAADDGPDDLLATPADKPDSLEVRTSDGTLLHVERHGRRNADADAPVVVAVHGWTCRIEYWNPQINHLAERYEVVAYDQRGHGRSERGRARLSPEILGQDLDAVLTHAVEPGRPVVLIGHSMGGMSILSWAQQFPDKVIDRIAAVVLTSTAADAVVKNNLLIPLNLPRYTKAFEPVVTRAFTSVPAPIPQSSAGSWMSHYMALGPKARRAHVDFVEQMIATCPPRTRAGWGAALGRLDVVAGLDALRVPTTVVVGTADRLTPPLHAEQMAKVLSDNGHLRDLVVYDGIGHMSSIEAASDYNQLLDDILDGLAASGA